MGRHPVDVLKAALQEAKTEAATLRIKTATLAQERNVAILERNVARARVKELEQQNAVQREKVDEAMRQNTRLSAEVESIARDCDGFRAERDAALDKAIIAQRLNTRHEQWWTLVLRPILVGLLEEFGLAHSSKCPAAAELGLPGYDPSLCDREVCLVAQAQAQIDRKPVGGPVQDRGGAALPPADTLARIRELEAEVQRLQRDRAQVGAFGFKPLGIR